MFRSVFLLLCLWFSGAAAADWNTWSECQYNSDGEIITNQNGFVDCVTSTGTQLITLQYIGLCESLPSVANYQNTCVTLFNEPTGRPLNISKGSIISLFDNTEVSIPEGTYTHAAIRVDAMIKIKAEYSFDKPMLGMSGIGKTCWTRNFPYNDLIGFFGFNNLNELATDCGQVATAGYLEMDVTTFVGAQGPVNSIIGRSSKSGPFEMYTLAAPNVLSSTNMQSLDGEHLFGIQIFNTPVKITAETENIDLGFRMDNMFHVQTNWQSTLDPFDNSPRKTSGDGVGNALPPACGKYNFGGNSCMKYVIPPGFEFSVSVE